MFKSYGVEWWQFSYLKIDLKCSARTLLFCFPVFEVMVPKVQTETFQSLLCGGSDSTNTTIRSAQDSVLYPDTGP